MNGSTPGLFVNVPKQLSQNIQFKLIWTEPVKYYANGARHDISLITENWLFDSFNQIDTIHVVYTVKTNKEFN